MPKTTTINPDRDDDRTPVQLVALSTTERTAQQVQTLLNIVTNCADVCAVSLESGDTFDPSPEVMKAASETYVQAMHQLRNIIDDMGRWGNDDDKDQLASDLVKGNLRIQKKQAAAIAESQKPHRRLNCRLRLFQAGWIAWVGADVPSGEVLHGVGASPKEALDNFDRNFEAVADQTDTSTVPESELPLEDPVNPEQKQ